MGITRKEKFVYYFSVEGETEKWYFEHLENLINDSNSDYRVEFVIKICKSISSRMKSISSPYPVVLFHIFDYEGNEPENVERFEKTLLEFRDQRKIKKNINCSLGYSNLTFDLWMILHKLECSKSFIDKKKYIECINKAYSTKYITISKYKEESNFKSILKDITLDDIIYAVKNANSIRKYNNKSNRKYKKEYSKFEYFTINPDLTINQVVERILKECGLM